MLRDVSHFALDIRSTEELATFEPQFERQAFTFYENIQRIAVGSIARSDTMDVAVSSRCREFGFADYSVFPRVVRAVANDGAF